MTLCGVLLFVTIQAVISFAQVPEDDLKKLADANNNLATSLYPRLIKGHSNNIFFCPLSLMTGLGVMMLGAKGNTQQELHSVLGYKAAGLDIPKVPTTYNHYLTHMLPQNNPRYANYSLLCGDEVLVTNRAPLNATIQEEATHYYDSPLQNVDFQYNDDLVRTINNFVYFRTYGKIRRLISKLDNTSKSVLINTVFFKGKFETPFPRYLTSWYRIFHSPRYSRWVRFMTTINKFPYFENSDYQAVFLPYIGGNLGLLVLKPRKRNGLSNLEKTMTPNEIVKVMKNLESQRTVVILPKFKFQYYRNFSRDFEELGAKNTYNVDSADFSGLTTSKGLSVSSTLYKGAFEVDDSGRNRWRINYRLPIISSVLVNHPFMFAVVDRRLNLILFMGRVTTV